MKQFLFAALLLCACSGGGSGTIGPDDSGTASDATSSASPAKPPGSTGSSSSSSPSPSPSPSAPPSGAPGGSPVAGVWRGSFKSMSGATGQGQMTLQASGGNLTGSIDFTSSPCFTTANVKGSVAGTAFSAEVTAANARVQLAAAVSGNSMTGTYSVIEGGDCTNDQGTFTFTKS